MPRRVVGSISWGVQCLSEDNMGLTERLFVPFFFGVVGETQWKSEGRYTMRGCDVTTGLSNSATCSPLVNLSDWC